MGFTKRDFRSCDFHALTEMLNNFIPDAYKVSSELVTKHTVKSPLFDWGSSIVIYKEEVPVAFVAVKKSAGRLYSGPDIDAAHITALAFTEAEAGVDAMAHVKEILKNRGATKLHFGQDNLHIFPGCPLDAKGLELFLTIEGFEKGSECVDLERDLSGFEALNPSGDGCEFRPLQEKDRESMLRFFEKTFPSRWRYDVLQSVSNDGIEHSVFGLLVDGHVEGFALLQDQSTANPIGGGVWHNSLGPNWGSLGPIGISKHIRGKGLGGALLGQGLNELKRRGVQRCIIDWTTLVDFYGKFGFQPTRRYAAMTLPF